jgi:hypothetical protein
VSNHAGPNGAVRDTQNPLGTSCAAPVKWNLRETTAGMAEYGIRISHDCAGAVRPLRENGAARIAQQLAQY